MFAFYPHIINSAYRFNFPSVQTHAIDPKVRVDLCPGDWAVIKPDVPPLGDFQVMVPEVNKTFGRFNNAPFVFGKTRCLVVFLAGVAVRLYFV